MSTEKLILVKLSKGMHVLGSVSFPTILNSPLPLMVKRCHCTCVVNHPHWNREYSHNLKIPVLSGESYSKAWTCDVTCGQF